MRGERVENERTQKSSIQSYTHLCSHERRYSSVEDIVSLAHIFTWFSDGFVAVLP